MQNPLFYQKKLLTAFIVTVVASLLSGCVASRDVLYQKHSSLPIEVVNSAGGEISNTRAFETATYLYVAGTMNKQRGYHLGVAAHVDVQLLDKKGYVIAAKADDIDPKHPVLFQRRGGRHSYVVGFSLALARQASAIRVIYHPIAH